MTESMIMQLYLRNSSTTPFAFIDISPDIVIDALNDCDPLVAGEMARGLADYRNMARGMIRGAQERGDRFDPLPDQELEDALLNWIVRAPAPEKMNAGEE